MLAPVDLTPITDVPPVPQNRSAPLPPTRQVPLHQVLDRFPPPGPRAMRDVAGLRRLDLPPLIQVQQLTAAMTGQITGLEGTTARYLRALRRLEKTVSDKEFEDLRTTAAAEYRSRQAHLELIAATSRLLRMASADADRIQYAGAGRPDSDDDVIELSSDAEDDDE